MHNMLHHLNNKIRYAKKKKKDFSKRVCIQVAVSTSNMMNISGGIFKMFCEKIMRFRNAVR